MLYNIKSNICTSDHNAHWSFQEFFGLHCCIMFFSLTLCGLDLCENSRKYFYSKVQSHLERQLEVWEARGYFSSLKWDISKKRIWSSKDALQTKVFSPRSPEKGNKLFLLVIVYLGIKRYQTESHTQSVYKNSSIEWSITDKANS